MANSPVTSPRAPRIGLYFTSVNRNSYLIAKTLELGGCRVVVRFEIPLAELISHPDKPGYAEREYCSWLYSEPGIQIVDGPAGFPEVDCLLYELRRVRRQHSRQLRAWMKKARHVAAWNTNDHEGSVWGNLRMELATVVRSGGVLPVVHSVVMQSGRTFLRPTLLFGCGRRQGYFVHPKFLREANLRAEMFATGWAVDTPRPVRLIFSGNPEPESRQRMITEIQYDLERRSDVCVLKHYENISADRASLDCRASVLWMVRHGGQDPQWHLRRDVVPPTKWPAVLRLCDFIFCPPGYERKTHRVVESLLQGVIPILDCPEEYDIGLRDGVTCLVARNGRWQQAIERALKLPGGDVVRMRSAVRTVALNRLNHAGAARDWLGRIGLKP